MRSRHRFRRKASCGRLRASRLTKNRPQPSPTYKGTSHKGHSPREGWATCTPVPLWGCAFCGFLIFMRKEYSWVLPRTAIHLGKRTAIMGILNVTPDSFSDAGQYFDLEKAVARGLEMEQEGADIIDIGDESSRPGSEAVPEEEETRRAVPVIERLARVLRIPISIDTYRSNVARRALEAG